MVDVGAMTDAVRWIQDKAWVDRLESTIEAHILPVAEVREACTIPGTSLRTAYLCRDKPTMKDALRAAGVPTAASTAADNAEQVQAVRRCRRVPADPQAAQRCRCRRHHPGRRPRPARPGVDLVRREGRRLDRGGGVRRGPRGLLRHAVRRRQRRPRTSCATTTPTCSRRCAPAGSPRSSSPPTGSTPSRTTSRCARWVSVSSRPSASAPARRTWSGSSDPRG